MKSFYRLLVLIIALALWHRPVVDADADADVEYEPETDEVQVQVSTNVL